MQKWEYRMLVMGPFRSTQFKNPDIRRIVNGINTVFKTEPPEWDKVVELGEEGWEMVGAFTSVWDGSTNDVAFVFKRPINEEYSKRGD